MLSPKVHAIGSTYSFIIQVTPSRIKVSSPNEINGKFSIIINNDSLSNLYGKVEDEGGKLVKFVAIPHKGHETVNISGASALKNYFFIPLSPPYQELKLVVGQDSYEIPPEI